jgi:RNA polymerase sigma factor (TIGR02999 family)
MEEGLADVRSGPGKEGSSGEVLLPLVYAELRKLAAARLATEPDTSTLQPTALVHEAWLRLSGPGQAVWKNRAHFFSAAAEAMRRILIDRARRKQALKRGARARRVDLQQVDVAVDTEDDTLLAVNEALCKLAAVDPSCAQLIKLRFFAGLDYAEAAEALGISPRTAKRLWTYGRSWLYRELSRQRGL